MNAFTNNAQMFAHLRAEVACLGAIMNTCNHYLCICTVEAIHTNTQTHAHTHMHSHTHSHPHTHVVYHIKYMSVRLCPFGLSGRHGEYDSHGLLVVYGVIKEQSWMAG